MRELPTIDVGTNRSKFRDPSYLGTERVGLKFRSRVTRFQLACLLSIILSMTFLTSFNGSNNNIDNLKIGYRSNSKKTNQGQD